jgi:hypothetical protein
VSDEVENDGHEFAWLARRNLALRREFQARCGFPWDARLGGHLVGEITARRGRAYDGTSVRDLLRFLRNACIHFLDLPLATRRALGGDRFGLEAPFHDAYWSQYGQPGSLPGAKSRNRPVGPNSAPGGF